MNISDEMTDKNRPEAYRGATKPQPSSKWGKGMAVLTTAFLVVAIVLCIAVVSQVLSKGYVSVGGYSMFRVSTGSMEPELPIGTLLVSKQMPISDIAVNDIVNYRAKSSSMLGMVITHRVISIQQGADGEIYLETKGDANQYPDASYVEQKNLIGKVVYRTEEGNVFATLLGILTSPVGFLACIVLPCLAFGMFTVRDCIKNVQKEIDSMSRQLKSAEEEHLEEELGTQEYQALCDRLRGEILKELNQGAEEMDTTE